MKTHLLCPRCGRRLIDAESSVRSEMRDMESDREAFLKRWVPDFYMKCWNCKAQVGIRKVG